MQTARKGDSNRSSKCDVTRTCALPYYYYLLDTTIDLILKFRVGRVTSHRKQSVAWNYQATVF